MSSASDSTQQQQPPRLGVALSGGGFRASFFHLGVLARLAELDVLRHVDVLSTVSGGTIVGAHYYIELKRLLEKEADPSQDDYLDLVRRVQSDFLWGTRQNVRARIFLNPYKNYRMLSPKYSRSDRIGDLYDRYFYKPAWQGRRGEGPLRDLLVKATAKLSRRRSGSPSEPPKQDTSVGARQIQLRWLKANPKAWKDRGFNPWTHNKDVPAKVPILVMNATTLNTGHNFRFEAVRMGEPEPEEQSATDLLKRIDVNERLEQGYFEFPDEAPRAPQVPASLQGFPLAKAVAASSCVPLVFHPLEISGMYRGTRVQLVDGGLHDNQGVQTLFDTECKASIVSDASGLMADQDNPHPFAGTVAPRSMSIYGSRVRIEQLWRACGGATALMHLLNDVPAPTVKPLPAGRTVDVDGPLTDYGVNRKVQKWLARMRTDLDAFTDVEAYSLMYSGYAMSTVELERWANEHPDEVSHFTGPGAPLPPDPGRWCFAPVAGDASSPAPPAGYSRLLESGHSLVLKCVWAAPRKRLRLAVLAAAVLAFAGLLAAGAQFSVFDLGPLTNWAWFGVIAFLPGLAPIAALLQLLDGKLYLKLGKLAEPPG